MEVTCIMDRSIFHKSIKLITLVLWIHREKSNQETTPKWILWFSIGVISLGTQINPICSFLYRSKRVFIYQNFQSTARQCHFLQCPRISDLFTKSSRYDILLSNCREDFANSNLQSPSYGLLRKTTDMW